MEKLIEIFKKRLVVLLLDISMIPLAWYGAYWLRFNLGAIPSEDLEQAIYALPFLLLVQSVLFLWSGLYRGIWRFSSVPDLVRIIKAVVFGVIISWLPLYILNLSIPRSILPLYAWMLISMLGGTRLFYRWFKHYYHGGFGEGARVLVVGAGQAADF